MSNWRSSREYQRIEEIFEDYWLNEPNEAEVTVCMMFKHSDGSVQSKRIIWKNPKFHKQQPHKIVPIKKLSEVMRPACTCM